MRAPLTGQAGVALVIVLLAIGLLSATAMGLVLSSTLERLVGANLDESAALANASESALEFAARELAGIANWDNVLLAAQPSTLVDGPPGPRAVAPGLTIDLSTLTNQLTCGRPLLCTDAQIRVATRELPCGGNNPRWRLFVHQHLLAGPLPAPVPPIYVVVWLGDDAAETDGDPLADGAGPDQLGRYIVRARAEAFGPRSGRHAIEAELSRVCRDEPAGHRCAPGIRVHSWRAVEDGAP